MKRMTWKLGASLIALALLSACGTDSTETTAPLQPASAEHSLLDGLTRVRPLNRLVPLDHEIVVSATIGAAGGRLSIPETGFELTVPPGAVARHTRFSVRALAGTAVAYEFEPHGTTFRRPLVANQSLYGTKPALGLLRGAYFPDRSLINPSGTSALVSELLGGVLNLLDHSFTWRINHFSGYIVAW